MNRKLMLLMVMVVLLSAVFVTAQIYEKNIFKEEIIYSDGTSALSGVNLNGVSVLGFKCSTGNCASGLGAMVFNNNSGVNSWIDLSYPNNLPAGISGYGLYFYKPGYLPFEAFVDYTYSGVGDINAPNADVNLSRKEICYLNLNGVRVNVVNGTIFVNSVLNSPFVHSGPLNLLPASLKSYYSNNLFIDYSFNNGTNVYTQRDSFNLGFSESRISSARENRLTGNVNVSIVSSGLNIGADPCLRIVNSGISVIANVPIIPVNDTTPPSLPTNLFVVDRGTSYITWNWTNPSDSDFLNNHVLINGTHVATTAGNSYNATGLLANTSYMITLHSVDLSENMNMSGISNVNSTLPLSVTNGSVDVRIISPMNNMIYTSSSVFLNISSVNSVLTRYNLDGGNMITYNSPVYLNNLSNGNHSIQAIAINGTQVDIDRVNFYVNVSGGNSVAGNISLIINSPVNGSVLNMSSALINISAENATKIYYKFFYGIAVNYSGPWIEYSVPFVQMQLSDGDYTLWAYANNSVNNATNVSYFSVVHSVGNDTTAPGSIQNLTLIGRGQTYLTWNWTNPSDLDFSYSVISIDGRITSGTNLNYYNLTGLRANTEHTIQVCTVDTSDNRDYSKCVYGTGRTLPLEDDGDGDGDGHDNNDGNDEEYVPEYNDVNYFGSNYSDFGNYSASQNLNREKNSSLSIVILILLFLLAILLLILVYVLMSRRR
ncbi:MAG: hypothetical protein AABX11_03095 [Nanoarchaeota archaeon]